ncbi:MAG TPA: WGxxGxxG family protein [Casimicrobiaceae bacterium]|nr:WGxxGxxG family protein [Casimicrobiaceae bacterium]
MTPMNNMRAAAGIVGLAVLCGSSAIAQTTSGSGPGTTGTTATTTTRVDDRRDFDWGWLGLLGLAGLAGLRRREHHDVTGRPLPR